MPEGHVIHRLAASFNSLFVPGVVRASSPQGRFDAGAALIDGRRARGFEAYGKHLLGHFTGLEESLHIHLGLFGKTSLRAVRDPASETVRLRLAQAARKPGATAMDLTGPTTCDLLTPDELAALLARIGPDPIRADADPERGWARVHKSSRSIGELLMDQRVAAGVGNIYRAEVLFRAGLDPTTTGRAVSRSQWDAMWADLVELMAYGVATGRIDTVREEHGPQAQGRRPRVDAHGGEVYVYRREGEPCLVCGAGVRRADMGGRNLFWCPRCQV